MLTTRNPLPLRAKSIELPVGASAPCVKSVQRFWINGRMAGFVPSGESAASGET